jgi:adenylylsulfate kinase
MVVWVIGLSGAGKTTVAREIYGRLKASHPNTVLLDGDLVREALGNDLGHTVEDRRRNAQRLTGMCRLLSEQGIHVVCAVLSIFREGQRWNRAHLRDYAEVYVEASFEALVARDPKGLYRAALGGKVTHVVGVDIPFELPEQPDFVIKNDGTLEELVTRAAGVVEHLPGLSALPTR